MAKLSWKEVQRQYPQAAKRIMDREEGEPPPEPDEYEVGRFFIDKRGILCYWPPNDSYGFAIEWRPEDDTAGPGVGNWFFVGEYAITRGLPREDNEHLAGEEA